jgi:hypothetical protein
MRETTQPPVFFLNLIFIAFNVSFNRQIFLMTYALKNNSVSRSKEDDVFLKDCIAALQVIDRERRAPKHLIAPWAIQGIEALENAPNT